MKSPLAADQQTIDSLDKMKKRVFCLQKKIKKVEDPEGYVQEIIQEKKDKYLSKALARFERRQANPPQKKEKKVVNISPECVNDVVVTTPEEQKTEQPLKQMTTEEEKVKVASISSRSKPIQKQAPPTALLRPPVTSLLGHALANKPTLLNNSRLLK